MNFNNDFLTRQANPRDLGTVVLRQDSILRQVSQSFMRVQSLDEVAGAIGALQYRTSDLNGLTRMVMSAINLFDEFGINAHLAGFNTNGKPQFWLSSDDGSILSGEGVTKMDADGLSINNIGSAIRIGTMDYMYMDLLVTGGSIPKIIVYALDTTELVLNGDFETGSLSNWSTVSGSPAVQSIVFKHGAYALQFGAAGEIASGAFIAVTASKWYLAQAWSQYMNSGNNGVMYIDWYTAGSVLISTSQVNLNQTAPTWTRSIQGVYSPATATQAKIRIKFIVAVADTLYVDDVSLRLAVGNAYGEMAFNDPNKKFFSFLSDQGLGLYDHNGNALPLASTGEAILGSSFSITGTAGTFQDTGLSVTLPGAGTYLITANVRGSIKGNAGTLWWLTAKFFNASDSVDITNSERLVALAGNTAIAYQGTQALSAIVTVTASKTIKLYACRNGSGTPTWTTSDIVSNADGRSAMDYFGV